MGVVCLPARRDYWKQGGLWQLPLVVAGMSRDFFDYIFCYFHCSYSGGGAEDSEDEDSEKEGSSNDDDEEDNCNDDCDEEEEEEDEADDKQDGDADDAEVVDFAVLKYFKEIQENDDGDGVDNDKDDDEENDGPCLAPSFVVEGWYDKVKDFLNMSTIGRRQLWWSSQTFHQLTK